ncbi:MAG: hypothetical protein LBL06_04875 [Treponema sp.]|nr:hypothetical protein [Treponema sp.]
MKIPDDVASVRLSDEYWSQYVIVENNSLDYPIKVEIDVVYSIIFRRNEPDYEKEKKLYSNIILPMQKTNVYLNVKGNYIVRAEKLYVRTYTSEGKPHDKVLTIIIH